MDSPSPITPGLIPSKKKHHRYKMLLLTTLAAIVVVAILLGSLLAILLPKHKTKVQHESSLYVVKGDGVYAINPKDHTTLWQYPLDANAYQVNESHLSSDQQTLYVLLYNDAERRTYLDAFDLKEQTHKWHVKIVDNRISSQIIDANGSIYISTSTNGAASERKSKVYALKATDGSQRWSINAEVNLGNVANGLLYTSFNSKLQTYKVSDGTPGWSITLNNIVDNFSTAPYVIENNLYIVLCVNFYTCNLHAYNASNGDTTWQSQSIDGSVSGDGIGSDLIIRDNHAYITTEAGDISAFELQHGTRLWKEHIGMYYAGGFGSISLTKSQNVLYAASVNEVGTKGTAIDINTGEHIWSQQISHDTNYLHTKPIGVDEKQHLVYYWTLNSIQTRSTTNGRLQHEYHFPEDSPLPHVNYVSFTFLWSGK